MRLAATIALAALFAVGAASAAPEAAPAASPSPAPLAFPVARHRLANGLELVVQQDRRTPRVAVSLWYHVGAKDEPAGRSGFAHLFEHLMLEGGSRHVSPGAFFKTLEGVGATNIQCTTTVDRTNYREVVPTGALEVALWLESDRMAFLLDRVDARVLEAQKAVIENERKLNYDDAPLRLVERAIRAEIFPPGHPNRRPPIGDAGDVARATLDDARAFFRAWYAPNDATLVLVGDVDMARAKPLVEKWFGAIPSRPLPPRAAPPPVRVAGEVRIEMEAQLGERYVLVSWPTPARFAEGDAELAVAQRILAGGRLQRRLMRDDLLARSVTVAHAQPMFGQLGELFEIAATATAERSSKELLAAIDDELARLRAGDVTDSDVATAKASVVADLVFSAERLHDRAERINEYAQLAGEPSFFERERESVARVTRAAIVEAARRWLPSDRRVVTFVAPNAKMAEAARVVRTTRTGGAP